MTKQLAEAASSWRTRTAVVLLLMVAALGTLLSTQQAAKANLPTTTATVTQSPAGPANVNPGSAVTYTLTVVLSAAMSNAADDMTIALGTPSGLVSPVVACAGGALGLLSGVCHQDNNVLAGTYTLTITGTAPASGTLAAPTGGIVCYDVDDSVSCTATDTDFVNATNAGSVGVLTITGVTGTATTTVLGGISTVTFIIPPGLTYCSDPNIVNGGARAFTAPDQTVTGLTAVTTTPSTAVDTVIGTHTVTVFDDATPGGTVSISTRLATAAVSTGCSSTAVTLTAANFVTAELRHMADDGTSVIALQDVNNNVRGSSHVVCTVAAGTTTAVTIPLNALSQINVVNTGGYNGTAVVGPQSPNFINPVIFTGVGGIGGGLAGATCFSWVSTGAGDQQISVVYTGTGDALAHSVSWDTDNSTTAVNKALIKEWNVLEDSVVNGVGANVTKSIALTINPATGRYQGTAYSITDIFRGSHTDNSNATVGPIALAGVNWTVTSNVATSCGALSGALTGTTTLLGDGTVSGQPSLSFSTNAPGLECLPGISTVVITITGSEPGPLGSGNGRTVTETVTITFTQTFTTKQVFLAWAGQRVILEHDWRSPGNAAVNGGTCPFGDVSNVYAFDVTYIKGGGPGNFLPSLSDFSTGGTESGGATETGSGVVALNGSDQATVMYIDASDTIQDNSGATSDDLPLGPQDSCISRVLYESEDPGEVDIEAFVSGTRNGTIRGDLTPLVDNQTKIAFVVYYMKIENVAVSLVSSVSKPTHNSSVDGLNDYDPGNPWDASKDVTTVDWNVSRDLLVRGRVKGWFTNSNPSGRAADTTNPLNALPANRWVMPDDWDLLAGGPHGEEVFGTAEAFRPEYDIMFAPNNASGIALGSPTGLGVDLITTVGASTVACPNGTLSFRVNSTANIVKGVSTIMIGTGTTVYTVTTGTTAGCSSSFITISAPLAAAPAAGTPIYLVVGTPFEGPYSLLDTPGLAANGLGSAAVSSTGAVNTAIARDTILADGDVDWWDAPMPPSMVTARIRGAGFIKQVLKQDVYFLGTADSVAQVYPNAFYYSNIPDSPFIPAVTVGGGYLWDSWGSDGPGIGSGQGPYNFWKAARVGSNIFGAPDVTLTSTDAAELAWIRGTGYPDSSIARDLVVYSDNHGEFMVTANGDFKLDYKDCVTNALGGGKHCKQGDKVGASSIDAVADYPDYRGKHFPVASNAATVTWTWGGYKDVTIEKGESDQYKYVVFHALDRDGFCYAAASYAESLHPVLSGAKNDTYSFVNSLGSTITRPAETVDFLIDSGDGIILATSAGTTVINQLGNRQFAPGVTTYDLATATAIGSPAKVFPAINASKNECQAWIKISNSLLGVTNVLTIAHDDEGDIGIDKIVDLQSTTSYSLSFRWSLVTWAGANNVSPSDALKGTGAAAGGNDILDQVTAVYGWDQAAQAWLAFFPSGVNVPGANDLTKLSDGSAYWVAIKAPGPVTWTIATAVG